MDSCGGLNKAFVDQYMTSRRYDVGNGSRFCVIFLVVIYYNCVVNCGDVCNVLLCHMLVNFSLIKECL